MPGFSTIVVGTDFTAGSAVALRQALRIAAWPQPQPPRLVVVHVIDTLVAIELEEALSPLQRGITEGLVDDAKRAWREFSAGIPGAERVEFEVMVNSRAAGILRKASAERADLLVLGAFGNAPPVVGIGTVATACVRSASSDVLLVRDTRPEQGASPFRRIVAAVDFSPTSKRAVARAAMVAARDEAELVLLHVFSAPWHRLHYMAPTPEADPAFQKQFLQGLRGRLEEFCRGGLEEAAALAGPGASRIEDLRSRISHVVLDHRGHRSGIVEHAEAVGADLIALGTRGRSNLRDMLLGSTAEKALRESRCSILAVKPGE